MRIGALPIYAQTAWRGGFGLLEVSIGMLLRVLLCLILAAPVVATPDDKVKGLNALAFKTLEALSAPVWDQRHALALSAALWKDGNLDAAETDLLEELTNESSPPGSVEVASDGAEATLTRQTASGITLVYLHCAKMPEQIRKTGWINDMGPFVVYAGESPQHETQIIAFLTLDLAHVYLSSNFANSYLPFRRRLQAMEERANALPPERVGPAKAVIYKAAEQLDRLESDRLQDFLYKYMQPKAESLSR